MKKKHIVSYAKQKQQTLESTSLFKLSNCLVYFSYIFVNGFLNSRITIKHITVFAFNQFNINHQVLHLQFSRRGNIAITYMENIKNREQTKT